MPGKLEATGRYRGSIKSVTLEDAKGENSQSVAFLMQLELDEYYGVNVPGEGEEFYGIDPILAYARTYIVKASGELNETGVRQIQAAIGWDGDFESLVSTDWSKTRIQCEAKEDDYQGKKQIKIAWIYHAEAAVGGQLRPVEESRVKSLSAQYGAQARALCGNNGQMAKPAGKPAAPPSRGQPKPAVRQSPDMPPPSEDEAAATTAGKIPF